MTTRRITAAAPIRVCDNGGWTDTWVARHGRVFNIAVCPLVTVQIEAFPRGTRESPVIIHAVNYGGRYAPPLHGNWGPHPLLEAAVRRFRPPDDVDIEIVIHSTAPAGASTGTSAAVVVALLGALDRLGGGSRTASAIAREAHGVETDDLGRESGVQDQLCSAFGGINFIDIVEYPRAVVTHLDVADDSLRELDRRLSLIYLGRPHSSSTVHETVVRELERLGPDCGPLNALRAAVVAGDLDGLGAAMRANTAAQAALDDGIVTRDAWRIFEIAAAHGAAGWKVNGAGGDGGSITLLGPARDTTNLAMLQAISQDNPALMPIPIAVAREGLRIR
jgi:D-glycero-alpha-D-manno-heptose-7-phosphate kinase